MKLTDFSNTGRSTAVCVITATLLTCGLTACGQKGALYLPEDNTSQVVDPQPLPDAHPPTLKDNAQNPNVDSDPIIDPQTPQDDENAY